jgi:hypothetical protein
MALEITQQIGTSRGITSEGYVRIESFEFRKQNGFLRVYPKLYMNRHEAASASRDLFDEHSPGMLDKEWEAQNFEIPEVYKFHLTESQVRSREFLRVETVSESVDQMVPDPENPGQEITQSSWTYDTISVSGSEEYMADVISTAGISENSIYEFAYPLLKAELKGVFGSDSVIDS